MKTKPLTNEERQAQLATFKDDLSTLSLADLKKLQKRFRDEAAKGRQLTGDVSLDEQCQVALIQHYNDRVSPYVKPSYEENVSTLARAAGMKPEAVKRIADKDKSKWNELAARLNERERRTSLMLQPGKELFEERE